MQITINIDGSAADILPKPEQVVPTKQVVQTKFRSDMNIFSAIDDLVDDYISEAMRQAGEGRGQRTRAAKLLGFDSYQAFAYWIKRKQKKNST